MKRMLLYFWCLLILCEPAATQASYRRIPIDKVWTGTPAVFGALEDKNTLYLAYYRPNRRMTVAAYDKTTEIIHYKELPSEFSGWDAHNSLALGMDAQGRLHISGNMHAEPLIYGRMSKPHTLSSLRLYNTMTGEEESNVTYPQFLSLPDKQLIFMYRSGKSGHGAHFINVWDGETWKRWIDAPLFSYSAEAPESAYSTLPTRDALGVWHMAWVWRQTPDAMTNCCIFYARSPDFKHWEDAKGHPLTLPLTHGDGTPVDDIPMKKGLVNNLKLSLMEDHRPVVTYQKLDTEGHTQVYNAYLVNREFVVKAATQWTTQWMPEGGGSLGGPLGFGYLMKASNGQWMQALYNGMERNNIVVLDDNLNPLTSHSRQEVEKDALIEAQLPPNTTDIALPKGMYWLTGTVRRPDGSVASGEYLRWSSYPANRDLPKACTPSLPKACAPPAQTLFLLRQKLPNQ